MTIFFVHLSSKQHNYVIDFLVFLPMNSCCVDVIRFLHTTLTHFAKTVLVHYNIRSKFTPYPMKIRTQYHFHNTKGLIVENATESFIITPSREITRWNLIGLRPSRYDQRHAIRTRFD